MLQILYSQAGVRMCSLKIFSREIHVIKSLPESQLDINKETYLGTVDFLRIFQNIFG